MSEHHIAKYYTYDQMKTKIEQECYGSLRVARLKALEEFEGFQGVMEYKFYCWDTPEEWRLQCFQLKSMGLSTVKWIVEKNN